MSLKILHILGDKKLPDRHQPASMSGIVRMALEIAQLQAAAGHSVVVLSVARRSVRYDWNGVRIVVIGLPILALPLIAGTIRNILLHLCFVLFCGLRHFDVVHAHSYNYLRLIKAKKRILHFHSDPTYDSRRNDKIHLSAAQRNLMINNCDAIICISSFIAGVVRSELGREKPIAVVYNGISLSAFLDDKPSAKRPFVRSGGLSRDDGAIFLLFAGAINKEKGFLHVARVFERLAPKYPQLHLIVAGAGDLWQVDEHQLEEIQLYEQSTRGILQSLARVERVHFLGKVPAMNMPEIYQASDIVVVPSIYPEGFGLVALEGLAAGKPVVASNVGGIPEIVNLENGILVAPGDEKALQQALEELIENPAKRTALGLAGRKKALQFSLENMVEQVMRVYGAEKRTIV